MFKSSPTKPKTPAVSTTDPVKKSAATTATTTTTTTNPADKPADKPAATPTNPQTLNTRAKPGTLVESANIAPANTHPSPGRKPVKDAIKNLDEKVMKEKTEQQNKNMPPNGVDTQSNVPLNTTRAKHTNPPQHILSNAPRTEQPEKNIKFAWKPSGADKVQISGSFNNWKDKLDMKNVAGNHELSIPLKPGNYCYKFIVDGEWCYDFTAPNEQDADGNVNNIITV